MHSFNNYKSLIKSLPIEEQAAYANRKRWKTKISKSPTLELWQTAGDPELITLTRGDLLDNCKASPDGVLHVLIWGYPSGGRGKNIQKCIKAIGKISSTILRLKKYPSFNNFQEFYNSCKEIDGLGISTWSKILYFNNICIGEYQCNIYDSVVENALDKLGINLSDYSDKSHMPKEFREYMAYLKFLTVHAKQIEVRTDQLEYFLFLFGNRFELNLNPE